MPEESRWRWTLRAGSAAAIVAVAAAVAIRLTVRDRLPAVAVLYYGTPAVLGAVAAAAGGAIAWRLGRRRWAAAGAALAAVSAALYVGGSFFAGERQEPGAVRAMFWNVRYGLSGWDDVAAEIRRQDPDVVWLAESGDGSGGADDALRAALPDHRIVREKWAMTVLVRGTAQKLAVKRITDKGHLALFRIGVKGREFTTLLADLSSTPRSRLAPLAAVRNEAERRLGEPLLVVGDFNTPRDSVAFDAWRGPLSHAFETAGRGLDATWPVPVPVLAIDHVWASRRIAIRTCEIPWTWNSDHLPVVFTFDVHSP